MADPWEGLEETAPVKITVAPGSKNEPKPWEGLEEPSSYIPRAFADIPKEIGSEFMHGFEKVKSGVVDRDPVKEGQVGSLLKTGSAILGVPQMALSPLVGGLRSLLGHPLADITHAAGMLINPEVAKRDDPAQMYEMAKEGVDLATAAIGRRGGLTGGLRGGIFPAEALPTLPPPGPQPPFLSGNLRAGAIREPPTAPSPPMPVAEAAERLTENISPVSVPQAIASENMGVQRTGQGIRNIPIIGDPIAKATGRTIEELGTANRAVAERFGFGTPASVSERIGKRVGAEAAAETSAAEASAQSADEALRNAWRTDVEGANAGVAANEARAAQDVRSAVGPDMTPQEMGHTAIERIRAAEREDFARKERLYEKAEAIPADVRADEVSNVGARIGDELFKNDIDVSDAQLTPHASKMWKIVQDLARLELPKPPTIGGGAGAVVGAEEEPAKLVALTAKALNQVRKKLNSAYGDAATPADQRAARGIIRAYDKWMDNAFENALLSGDPNALPAWRAANRQNREWREKFYNNDNDATKFVEKIVNGEVTPQEFANLIVGSGEAGVKGVGSRMLTHFERVFGEDAEIMQALRSGVMNRLMQNPEGVTQKSGQKIYDDIYKFFNTTGEDMSRRIFTAAQRERIEAYGETVRQGKADRSLIEDIAKNTEPTPTEVAKGPAQQLADTIGGDKHGERLFETISGYARREGGRADLKSLAELLRSMPQEERGNLSGAMIRNMGKDGETGFSYEKFATAWDNYSPGAKDLLFGNAGPHRKALDDISEISKRLRDIHKRFGNPAGTSQNLNFAAMLGTVGAAIAAPVGTAMYAIPPAVIGAIGARVLSQPATAAAAAKWSRAALAAATRKSANTLAALQSAQATLVNTARSSGLGGRTAQDENSGQQ
jgi:hypothetical protein